MNSEVKQPVKKVVEKKPTIYLMNHTGVNLTIPLGKGKYFKFMDRSVEKDSKKVELIKAWRKYPQYENKIREVRG